ncbi:MAG: MFS transporter [Polyangiaceae bacterium]
MSAARTASPASSRMVVFTVLVAALGYFVDIFDLLVFSVVRKPSLIELGVTDAQQIEIGTSILNWQMGGLLLGGILWGVLGDKRGRLSVLFGSILMYSLANIANGFVHDVALYRVLRFVAGVGLSGELGAAITLVSEVLPKEKRGYGTAVVAGVGVAGAVVAGFVGELMHWRNAYFLAGGLGLALLALRVGVAESSMFASAVAHEGARRGDLALLVGSRERVWRYVRCILVGIPLWFLVGILITFSPEFAKTLGVTGPITAGRAIAVCYGGLVFGDLGSGLVSQWLKSRKRALFLFSGASLVVALVFLNARGVSPVAFYAIIGALGVVAGYWAVFVTVAAEQFGTNLRATVATTVPNFVRGAVIPITLLFRALAGTPAEPRLGIVHAATVLAVALFAIGFWGIAVSEETFGKDLDFLERD